MTQTNALGRLTAMGFAPCGEWTAQDDKLVLKLTACANARNVLYAFVIEDAVMYIGKTVTTLKTRMQGYRLPSSTQSTNIRNNRTLRQVIESGKLVTIYVLPDNGLLHYGGFHVNLAAGLEDSLVRDMRPPWNGGKKETGEPPLTTPPSNNSLQVSAG